MTANDGKLCGDQDGNMTLQQFNPAVHIKANGNYWNGFAK